jgi:hypothetical protein
MSKRERIRACEAHREGVLRAHEHDDATPTDLKLLNSVC